MSDIELNKLLENWGGQKVRIRPSSVDSFMNCPRQWAMTHIGGISSMQGGRAAIGTAIHAAVEGEWQLAMASKKKDFNVTSMADAAEAELVEIDLKGILYDRGEDLNTAVTEATNGARTFAEDIVPFTDIPMKVEERYTIKLDNPVAEDLSGTVDYLGFDGTLADVKTSKRKPVPANYNTQQTIYKLLAEANGVKITQSIIQGVVLKTKPEGHILALEPNEAKAKYAVNTLLNTLTTFHEQKVAPDVLFRGNPKYYLCSNKYCALHDTCPFVQGAAVKVAPKVGL